MTRTVYRGSVEYLDVEVTASITLADATPVAFSFDDCETWHEAEWEGEPGTTRTATLVVNDAILGLRTTECFVQITDDPEIPIIFAGQVHRA